MVRAKTIKKNNITRFRPQIRSRHPSHAPLRVRGVLTMFPVQSVVRFGSSTELPDTVANGGNRIELNTVKAISNSSNKILMKQCFNKLKVKTARWWLYNKGFFLLENNPSKKMTFDELNYPIIAKHKFGSRGRGNVKINSSDEMQSWLSNCNQIQNFVFEVYLNFTREYRLHVTEQGCFYTCRKVIKNITPKDERWFRNDSNSSWLLESNPRFQKPVNWEEIVHHCILALKSVGLDFGAVDLKVQAAYDPTTQKKRNKCDFIVIEINSAPSFGEKTLTMYKEMLSNLLLMKKEEVL